MIWTMNATSFLRSFAGALLMLGLLSVLSCNRGTEEQRKRQTLPDFKFEALEGGELSQAQIAEGKPIVILYFDPDCSHCKETIASILAVGNAADALEWVLVSPADKSRVIPFLQENGLSSRPNFHAGLCSPQQFLDTFGTTQAPTTLFYAEDHDLKRAYKGKVDKEGILTGIEMASN
jgi:hypothetical protein